MKYVTEDKELCLFLNRSENGKSAGTLMELRSLLMESVDLTDLIVDELSRMREQISTIENLRAYIHPEIQKGGDKFDRRSQFQ
ncbi:hypothetical protein AVEN_172265-1 [Araneus ventricosus]|uniref:Uncharacterized protein n=1 Tax=Araneus ventricosus TaxID=182803 RepID=A0A4Y2N0G1_ARAVE|nr:hypothetical protein AVEN_172265-1 [Araneus ventricosus]